MLPRREKNGRLGAAGPALLALALAAAAGAVGCSQVGTLSVGSSGAAIVGVTTTAATISLDTTSTMPISTTTSASAALPPTTTVYTNPITAPARIVIPAIECDAKIVAVGIDKNGAMEVPSVAYAGWYKLGPAPGQPGPAVIVSHVSWAGTHGPFYDLKKLKPGDTFTVFDQSGTSATFQVDSNEITLKTKLPTEKIWNNTREPVIRLVTCGGRFDSKTRHYLSNVIVYGHLIK